MNVCSHTITNILMEKVVENEIGNDQININSTFTNLPDVVASMEMLTVDSEMSNKSSSSSSSSSNNDIINDNNSNNIQQRRYSLRNGKPRPPANDIRNRRCSRKPQKKRAHSTLENNDEIEEYYLDKNIKKKPNTKLETIFEENNDFRENSNVISARSFNRFIQFKRDKRCNDAKIKKRKAKVRRIFGSNFKLQSNRLSMHAFLKKLNSMRAEVRSSCDD